MIHGFALHANGRVLISEHGPKLVVARVRAGDGEPNGRVEGVRLEVKNERLLVGCSCPARSFGMMTCKHSWAVLLEADLKDALGELKTSLKPCIVEAIDVPTPEQDEADSTEVADTDKTARRKGSSAERADPKRSERTNGSSAKRAKAPSSATAAAEASPSSSSPSSSLPSSSLPSEKAAPSPAAAPAKAKSPKLAKTSARETAERAPKAKPPAKTKVNAKTPPKKGRR